MKTFSALLRLQLLTRYADLKPRNLKNALKEKRGRTIGMIAAIAFLVIYLGVMLYIVETKALDILMQMKMGDLLLDLAVVLSTAGTLVMAFFFIMSSLYLGRDAAYLASMPIKTRTLLGAKLTQVWISETLIDAVILLPACILYGTRVGMGADFYLRMVLTWLMIAILPICAAAAVSAFLIRISVLWKHREVILTVGGILLFAAYMILMMNLGSITGGSEDANAMMEEFFTQNSARIAGMTRMFPPAEWAARGLQGEWGMLGLYALVSAAAAALLLLVLGIFYRKLSLLQAETPLGSGKKGIQKGSIQEGNAFKANVLREFKMILRVPSYATNILPIALMPLLMIIMIGMTFKNSAGGDGSVAELMAQLNPALIMCIMGVAVAYMSGMNPALSTAVSREGKGHDFLKALPVSGKTLIYAKLTVGLGLECFGVITAFIALMILIPGHTAEALLALVLCLVFCAGCACLALSRDVKKPRLDWVTEQEAVKQNFGVLISMLLSWGILAALAVLCYFMLSAGWTILPVFAVLLALLAAFAFAAYRLLMRNAERYYCRG